VATSRPHQLLQLACQAARASYGCIALLSADGELIDLLSVGLSSDATDQVRHSPWLTGLVELVLSHDVPTRIPDLGRVYCPPEVPRLLPPLGSLLGTALACPGRCRGALFLLRRPEEPAFGPEQEEPVQTVATWLEQGNVSEEARLLVRLRVVNKIAQAGAGDPDLMRILKVALGELNCHLPLNVCSVWLLAAPEQSGEERGLRALPRDKGRGSKGDADLAAAPGGSRFSGSGEYPPSPSSVALVIAASSAASGNLGMVPGLRMNVGDTPFAPCLERGEAFYADLHRPEERTGRLLNDLAGQGADSCFAVPLRAGEQTVGILQSVCTRPTGITAEQIQLLYLVADLLGPAVSSGQLFDRLRGAYEQLRLMQNQLVQAEKMRALGELAGGMAHEFNNSLCGALGFMELTLLSADLSPVCRTYLESARTCAQDAANTVRRVQDFARQRRNEMAFQALDLNDLVQQTVELCRHKWENLDQTRSGPIKISVESRATSEVSGSPTELREVLTNLLFNAVDAMPRGGTLQVRTWSTPTDVFLAVQDTGVGINRAVRQRLFEPFFTTKGERGSGLGLSVSFGIVRRHGGEIAVDSQVGRGTTFTVRLPRLADTVKSDQENTPLQVPVTSSRSLRVLVIDDEVAIRNFLEMGLSQLGHRPRITADGRQGLKAFAEERFDVVLTDLDMPEVSGEEVARTIAQKAPGTPVVLLTGWADRLQQEIGSIEGVAHILSKPVTIANLSATLTAVSAQPSETARPW
jgi:signal transduction histidine kinase/ActR/RegA family two-component response regulator